MKILTIINKVYINICQSKKHFFVFILCVFRGHPSDVRPDGGGSQPKADDNGQGGGLTPKQDVHL